MRNIYEQMLLGAGAVIKSALYGALFVFEEAYRVSTNVKYVLYFLLVSALIFVFIN